MSNNITGLFGTAQSYLRSVQSAVAPTAKHDAPQVAASLSGRTGAPPHVDTKGPPTDLFGGTGATERAHPGKLPAARRPSWSAECARVPLAQASDAPPDPGAAHHQPQPPEMTSSKRTPVTSDAAAATAPCPATRTVYAFQQLWDLGYRLLVPIVPPGAEISERSTILKRLQAGRDDRGKTPGVRGRDGLWRGFDWRPYTADEADLERWHAMDAGTGIKTGAQPDGTSLILIDADTLNEDHARTIRDAVERHFVRLPARIGRYPKVGYPIRAAAPCRYQRVEFGQRDGKGRLLDRVELLSDGRQFVAAGIHPGTGEPYHWPQALVPYTDLPIVEPAALTAFLDDLRAILPAASDIVREGATTDVNQASLAGSPALVRKTVGLIPNTTADFPTRESWLAVGYAIRAALPDAPHEGLAIFREWSEKWAGELDEDGTLVTNDPGYTEAEWDRMKPPFRRGIGWLCELAEQQAPDQFNIAELWFDIIEDNGNQSGATEGEGEAWPEPLDVYVDDVGMGFRDLDESALPPTLWRYARDEAERIGVPVLFVAAGVLAVVSVAPGACVRLQPKTRDTGWTVQPFVWFLIVASSGQRKTAAISAPVKVLLDMDAQRDAEDIPRRNAWEAEAKKRGRKEAGRPLPQKPPRHRRTLNNFTVEGLRDLLAENMTSVLVDADEVAGMIGSAGQYKNGSASDRADLLKLNEGAPLAIERAGGKSIYIPRWGASILGSTQPERISPLASGLEADGLLQRFISVVSDDVRRVPVDREPDATAQREYVDLINRLAGMAACETTTLHLSREANRVREEFDERLNVLIDAPGAPAFKSHLSKWGGFFARLLLIFHLASDDALEDAVSVDTARRCARCADVLLSHAFRFYEGTLGIRSTRAIAQRAAGAILELADATRVTARDIYRKCREWDPENKDLYTAMRLLEHHGWVRPVFSRVPGRPPEKWDVNPKVREQFADRAEAERGRRELARKKICAAGKIRAEIANAGAAPSGIFS